MNTSYYSRDIEMATKERSRSESSSGSSESEETTGSSEESSTTSSSDHRSEKKKGGTSERKHKRGEQRKVKKQKKTEETPKPIVKGTGGTKSGRLKAPPASKEKDRETKRRTHREKSKTAERPPIEVRRGKPTASQIQTAAERAIEDMNQ